METKKVVSAEECLKSKWFVLLSGGTVFACGTRARARFFKSKLCSEKAIILRIAYSGAIKVVR